MKKKKIGLLGGAFDPITKGHIQIAHFVMDKTDIEEIWLVPCYGHAFDKDMSPIKDRLKMCHLASRLEPNIKVSDLDIQHHNKYTVDFVEGLTKGRYGVSKNLHFSMIIGMDNANNFDKWFESDKLRNMIRFIVVPRQGVEENPKVNWYKKHPHVYLKTDNPIIEISSTQIRKWIKKGEFPNAFFNMEPYVYEYAVMKKNLY